MTAGLPRPAVPDPLAILRSYRGLAPWSLRDLSALAGAILDASNVVPVNAAARARPSERTIRFYVARGLVSPPEGRGTAAIYTYRHLLQVLAIKLRQMDGATLSVIVKELDGLGGDMVERRVAAALGEDLPPPDRLQPVSPTAPRGRAGRALQAWIQPPDAMSDGARTCRRIPLGPGAEQLLDAQHPALRGASDDETIADALRLALASLVPAGNAPHH